MTRDMVPAGQGHLFPRRSRDVIDGEIDDVQKEIIRLVAELAELKQERGDNDEKSGADLLTAEEIALIERDD